MEKLEEYLIFHFKKKFLKKAKKSSLNIFTLSFTNTKKV